MLPSAMGEGKAERGWGRRSIRKEAEEEEVRRWRRLSQVDIRRELEKLAGKGATFRGVQEEAIRAIMSGKSPVVTIMATGGGKSLLFMLPAACSEGLTVVIVPLVSLRADMMRRCVQAGIECVEWNSRRPAEWASIVLVTPEAVARETFRNFVMRQRAMGRLDRIVVDECHVVLDSRVGWRKDVLRLRELVGVESQLVFLTATLPPREEDDFRQLMALPEKSEMCWFRGASTKRNVGYRVMEYDVAAEETVLEGLLRRKLDEFGEGQVVVYCGTVAKTTRMAERLGCVSFHREVGSDKEKARRLTLLTEGRERVFTATNALGLGVDAPTIRVVIHVGTVRRIRDYVQESGRAGRDGRRSEAILWRGMTSDRRTGVFRERRWDETVEEGMWDDIAGQGCRRIVLDREMDGRTDRAGCEEGEERCDRCVEGEEEEGREGLDVVEELEEDIRAKEGGLEGGIEARTRVEWTQEMRRREGLGRRERERRKRETLEVMRLEEKIERWSVGCVLCRGTGEMEERVRGHVLGECSREVAGSLVEYYLLL